MGAGGPDVWEPLYIRPKCHVFLVLQAMPRTQGSPIHQKGAQCSPTAVQALGPSSSRQAGMAFRG